jgi:hypothetical protein
MKFYAISTPDALADAKKLLLKLRKRAKFHSIRAFTILIVSHDGEVSIIPFGNWN